MKIKEGNLKKFYDWEYVELKMELEEKLEQLSLWDYMEVEI